jgi:hypothetical protein
MYHKELERHTLRQLLGIPLSSTTQAGRQAGRQAARYVYVYVSRTKTVSQSVGQAAAAARKADFSSPCLGSITHLATSYYNLAAAAAIVACLLG